MANLLWHQTVGNIPPKRGGGWLQQLEEDRERRERAAADADAAFSVEFLSMASKVFLMIDVDQSGTLTKAEVVRAVTEDKVVKEFIINCGNKNLQYLLVTERLESALKELDTSNDGEIDASEWEVAIEHALSKKLEDRAAVRQMGAAAAQAEVEEFKAEFLTAARECFEMIDVDKSGTLQKEEILKAVKENKKVIKFLQTCGEPNLQFLLHPKRLEDALNILDTSKDGELDVEEWEMAINKGLDKRFQPPRFDERWRAEAWDAMPVI